MPSPFKPFEEHIDSVFRRCPGQGKEEVLLTRLFYHVFKLLDERTNEVLGRYGLNPSTWLALLIAYARPYTALNPSALSEVAVSSRTNITRVADELEKQGWLERRVCAEDRRRLELALTPEGVAFVEQALPVVRGTVVGLWAGLTAEERRSLKRLLRRLMQELAPDADRADGAAEEAP